MLRHINPVLNNQKQIFISTIHWNWDIIASELELGNKDPWNHLLSRETYSKELNYTGNNEVVDENEVYFAPNMTLETMNAKLSLLKVKHSAKLGQVTSLSSMSRREEKEFQNAVKVTKSENKIQKYKKLAEINKGPKSADGWKKLAQKYEQQLKESQETV